MICRKNENYFGYMRFWTKKINTLTDIFDVIHPFLII
jgi:hypothetical protein